MSLLCPQPASSLPPLPDCPQLGWGHQPPFSPLVRLTQQALGSCCGPCFLRSSLGTPGASCSPAAEQDLCAVVMDPLQVLLEVPKGDPPFPAEIPHCRPSWEWQGLGRHPLPTGLGLHSLLPGALGMWHGLPESAPSSETWRQPPSVNVTG